MPAVPIVVLGLEHLDEFTFTPDPAQLADSPVPDGIVHVAIVLVRDLSGSTGPVTDQKPENELSECILAVCTSEVRHEPTHESLTMLHEFFCGSSSKLLM
jgi:hypothetical protein